MHFIFIITIQANLVQSFRNSTDLSVWTVFVVVAAAVRRWVCALFHISFLFVSIVAVQSRATRTGSIRIWKFTCSTIDKHFTYAARYAIVCSVDSSPNDGDSTSPPNVRIYSAANVDNKYCSEWIEPDVVRRNELHKNRIQNYSRRSNKLWKLYAHKNGLTDEWREWMRWEMCCAQPDKRHLNATKLVSVQIEMDTKVYTR